MRGGVLPYCARLFSLYCARLLLCVAGFKLCLPCLVRHSRDKGSSPALGRSRSVDFLWRIWANRGITSAELWTICGRQKILKLLAATPCGAPCEGRRNLS